jgi:hypothetical protein
MRTALLVLMLAGLSLFCGCITFYDQSKTDLQNPTFNFNISGTMDLGQLLGKIDFKKVTATPTLNGGSK